MREGEQSEGGRGRMTKKRVGWEGEEERREGAARGQ